MRSILLLVAVTALALPLSAQEGKKLGDPRKADFQKRVDEAIAKGVQFLKGQEYLGQGTNLVLWTLVHAGVPESDPFFKSHFDRMISFPLQTTYQTSIEAMILEELDRVKHQERIWKCAQFLVDNMAPSGEWGYGQATTYGQPQPAPLPTPTRERVATSTRSKGRPVPGLRVKPPVLRGLKVTQQRDGVAHDNSNSQYAALGLRACHDAGIILPKEIVQKAMKWWHETQSEGAPAPASPEGARTPTGGAVPAEGWDYRAPTEPGRTKSPYGSMTVGAVGALCIYHYILDNDGGQKKSWANDPAVRKGVEWIARNFSVTENPPKRPFWYYYYLYGLERAGILYGTEWFGTHEWYPEGAKELLESQQADGSWVNAANPRLRVYDTCFAILFLRRATQPLRRDVASVDRFGPNK